MPKKKQRRLRQLLGPRERARPKQSQISQKTPEREDGGKNEETGSGGGPRALRVNRRVQRKTNPAPAREEDQEHVGSVG